ncbi:acyltransferase family protein [Wenyingzhuangia sp. IMCC45467]
MYLQSLNYFRAIAIIFVISSHVFYLVEYNPSSVFELFIYNTIVGSSTPFVFISGFLFHHVFCEKYKFKQFLGNKIKYVLLPYLLMSIAAILFILYKIYIDTLDVSINDNLSYIKTILFYYVTGSHIVAYWYVPFVMLLFLTSPLHVLFINKLKTKQQIIITLIFLFISVLVHRPNTGYIFKAIQAVFYYTPVYLIGIICSMNKEYLYRKFKKKELLLFCGFLIFVFFQIYFNSNGNSFKSPFKFEGFDLMILQKILLSIFLFVILHKLESIKIPFLNIVAKYSFGMFFIHGYVMYAYGIVLNKFISPSFMNNYSFCIYLGSSIIIIFISLLLVMLIKKVFNNKSRYLIGS